MKIRSIPHLIAQGFLSFFRNGVMTTASILVLISCMLVLGSFYLIIDNIDRNFSQIDELNVINAYVDKEADDEAIKGIEERIGGLSNIKEYRYVSKRQALEDLKERSPSIADILDRYTDETNPISASFRITFREFDGVKPLIRDLSSIEGIYEVESKIGVYESIDNIKSSLTLVGTWMMAILLIVAFLVIMNTVKLTVYSRRQEIAVMRYIGATSSFVIAPFIVEGMIIGLVSAAIAVGIQYYIYENVMVDMVGSYGIQNMTPFSEHFPVILLAFIAIGVFSGIIASSVSIKKHLDV